MEVWLGTETGPSSPCCRVDFARRGLSILADAPRPYGLTDPVLILPDDAMLILPRRLTIEAQLAALKAIAREGPADPQVKRALLEQYAHLAENGPRRDPGCLLRAAILATLRPAFTRADTPLLEQAAQTYEHVRKTETAAELRAQALVALDDVDDTLAAVHAMRLLLDRQTTRRANEAALTAVRVLATRGHWMPLVLYAMLEDDNPIVVSECLRGLTAVPAALLPALIDRHARSHDEPVLIGLVDLLIGHEAWRDHRDVVVGILRSASQYEAHYYIAMSIVAHRPELVADLLALAQAERDTTKLRNIIDALSVRAFDAELAAAVAELERKLSTRTAAG